MNNEKIIVDCDSINGIINVRSSNGDHLVKMEWCSINNNDTFGFNVKNADFLINTYPDGIYILDYPAVMRFIMNVAERVAYDQGVFLIEYLDGDGNEREFPYFMPNTINDEDVNILPTQYMEMHDMWDFFVNVQKRNLTDIFIDSLAEKGLLNGFLDLINVDFSLIPNINLEKELNNE